jgi:predicted AlkP superfamily pyrophosphatase or phosphodiesterase
MNFQAVSVGQKLIENGRKGGYTDAAGTPTPDMQSEISFVDGAIGQMVAELTSRDLLESTVLIVTAKHGQSPIDPTASSRFPATASRTARRRRHCWPDFSRHRRPAASDRQRTTCRCSG